MPARLTSYKLLARMAAHPLSDEVWPSQLELQPLNALGAGAEAGGNRQWERGAESEHGTARQLSEQKIPWFCGCQGTSVWKRKR